MEPNDRDQLRDLKRCAAESGLDAQQAQQCHDLLQKQVQGRATKRADKGQTVTCDMHRTFCQNAADQLGRFPGGPADADGQAAAEQQPGAGSADAPRPRL